MIRQVLAWIIVGAIAGWLASALMGERRGCLANTVLGIIGAMVGGVICGLLLTTVIFGINLVEILMATFGAIIMVTVWRSMTQK